jgi:hypothetical protein
MKPLVHQGKKSILFALLAIALATAAAAQSPILTKAQLTGSREVVFDTTNQCELADIPDAPTRAFRDATGFTG